MFSEALLAAVRIEIAALRRAVDALLADPRRSIDARRNVGDAIDAFVVSSAAVSGKTDEWDYTWAPAIPSATSLTGLVASGTPSSVKARNRWEQLALAGYDPAGSVTGIKPIPNDAPISVRASTRNGSTIYLFAERNEPDC